LLAVEDQQRQNSLRGASSRHSRFGTTIAVSVGNKGSNAAEGSAGQTSNRSMIIHRQRAIKQGAGDVLDLSSGKKTKASRTKKTDEVSGREDQLSLEARQALREYAVEMLRAGFNREHMQSLPMLFVADDDDFMILNSSPNLAAQRHKVGEGENC
jgi:replication fork protection complex subunit Tof1/Swi1